MQITINIDNTGLAIVALIVLVTNVGLVSHAQAVTSHLLNEVHEFMTFVNNGYEEEDTEDDEEEDTEDDEDSDEDSDDVDSDYMGEEDSDIVDEDSDEDDMADDMVDADEASDHDGTDNAE